MTIPNIPTDDLYKFLSISGLLIVILSVGAPQYFQVHIKERLHETNREISIFGARFTHNTEDLLKLSETVDLLESRSKKLKTKIDKLSIQLKGFKKELINIGKEAGDLEIHQKYDDEHQRIVVERDNLKEELESISKKLVSILGITRTNEILEIEINSQVELNSFYINKFVILSYLSIIGFICGLLMTIFGFYNWYTKIQLPSEKNKS